MAGLRERIERNLRVCSCCKNGLGVHWRTFAGEAVCKFCYRLLVAP